jgi:hypothetical protein
LLFATHPVHVEAVASIVGRAEVLSAIFFLLALLAYIRACDADSKAHTTTSPAAVQWVGVSLACVALAVLSKEQGVTVVAVCLAYDLFVHQGFALPWSTTTTTTATSAKKTPKVSWGPFATRQALLWGGFAVIMALRLRLNTQEIVLDQKTNPGNHVVGFLYRALTKNLYVALHAQLLLLVGGCGASCLNQIPTVR